MSKYTRLVKDTLIFGIGNFTTKLIYFFLMPIYTLCLSAYEFGIADLLNNSLQLIVPILTLSISDAVFRFSLDREVRPSELLNGGLRILSYSYVITFVGIGIVIAFKLDFYWCCFGLLYISDSLKSLLAQYTRGLGKVNEYALNGIIAACVLLITSYIFLKYLSLGINGYLLAYIVSNIAACAYLLFRVGIIKYINFHDVNNLLIKSMIAFSLPLIPNMLSWWFTNISSRYIIALFSGISLSGLFAAASKIPALINVLSSIFQLSWQFASVKEYQESQNSEFYSIIFKYYNIAIIISGAIIIAFLPQISVFILKNDFYQAWVYSPLLMFSSILGCLSIFFGTFYTVVKDNKKAMITTLIGATINISICFITIPLIGVTGALIANVASYAVIVYLRVKDCKKYISLSINWLATLISLSIVFAESILMMTDNVICRYSAYCLVFILVSIYIKDLLVVSEKLKGIFMINLFRR